MDAAPVVVDACSSINLFATGRAAELLRASGLQLIVLPEIFGEAQYLLGDLGQDGERAHLAIDWSPLLDSGLAGQQPLPEEALAAFLEFAADLTDNDARCATMACHLGCGLLSDDGKVRRTFVAKCPELRLLSTVSVVQLAAEPLGLDGSAMRVIFQRIRERARFEPSRRDPAFEWYRAHAG